MSISKDKEETSERLEESVDSSMSSELLLGNDDSGKAGMQGTEDDKNERRKEISFSLSRKEIEEDFLKIRGTKPIWKPRLIPKHMQKQRDALFPRTGPFIFQTPLLKRKKAPTESLEELADSATSSDSSTSSEPLLRNDDLGKADMQGTVDDKKDRLKEFSISLTRKEIEEDLLKIKGTKPYTKPRLMPKYMQNQHDTLFPGSGLPKMLRDLHKRAD